MQIIVNATFLINTIRINSEILQLIKLSTIKNVADEIQNELGVEIDNYNIEILQKGSCSIDLSNDKKTPEFVAFLLRKGTINKDQCITFLNILKKIYIRTRDIDKVLKRIEGW